MARLGGGAEVGEDALADRADQGGGGAAVAGAGGAGGRVDAADHHLQQDVGRVLAGEGARGQLLEERRHHVLQGERRAQHLFDQLAGQLRSTIGSCVGVAARRRMVIHKVRGADFSPSRRIAPSPLSG